MLSLSHAPHLSFILTFPPSFPLPLQRAKYFRQLKALKHAVASPPPPSFHTPLCLNENKAENQTTYRSSTNNNNSNSRRRQSRQADSWVQFERHCQLNMPFSCCSTLTRRCCSLGYQFTLWFCAPLTPSSHALPLLAFCQFFVFFN